MKPMSRLLIAVAALAHIPYHNSPTDTGKTFDRDAAAAFDAPNALVVTPGESIRL